MTDSMGSIHSINESDNGIYKQGIERTKNALDKLEKTKMRCFNNDCVIGGTKNDILSHLKGGPAKNLVNSWFKCNTDKCDYCGEPKSKTTQLDRAHCNKDSCDRSSLLEKSIHIHYIDEQTPIKIKDILKTFIKYHEGIPLFILCKKCHHIYDNKCLKI